MRLKPFCLGVRNFLFIGLSLTAGPAGWAEVPATGGGAPGAAYGAQNGSGQPTQGGKVQVFSDGVFNVDQPPPAPAAGITAGGRYSADAPDFNAEQQAQWKAACASQRNVDGRAYRDCYLREKASTQDRVRRSFDRPVSGGFSNVGAPSPLDAPKSSGARPSDALDPDGLVGKEPDREKENIE